MTTPPVAPGPNDALMTSFNPEAATKTAQQKTPDFRPTGAFADYYGARAIDPLHLNDGLRALFAALRVGPPLSRFVWAFIRIKNYEILSYDRPNLQAIKDCNAVWICQYQELDSGF